MDVFEHMIKKNNIKDACRLPPNKSSTFNPFKGTNISKSTKGNEIDASTIEYKIPENIPLKEIMNHRVKKFTENNPERSLKDMYSNLASNWDTYAQILNDAAESDDGTCQSVSKYALSELHQFGYISIQDDELANMKRERFYDDFVTSYRAQKKNYKITKNGRKAHRKILANKLLISEFLKNYKNY